MENLNKHRTVLVNIFFIVSLISLYVRFGKRIPIEGDGFMACYLVAFLKMWFAQGSIGLNRILNNCMI